MYECYKLTFERFIIDLESGERFKVEEPLIVQHVFDTTNGGCTYVLNSILERMKHEVLNRAYTVGVRE